jgi:hypothetical protein
MALLSDPNKQVPNRFLMRTPAEPVLEMLCPLQETMHDADKPNNPE